MNDEPKPDNGTPLPPEYHDDAHGIFRARYDGYDADPALPKSIKYNFIGRGTTLVRFVGRSAGGKEYVADAPFDRPREGIGFHGRPFPRDD